MFVAIDQNGEKQFAFYEDKERLYSLAQAKEIYCPHCHKHVFFRGGPKRIHHFYHERHVECSFVGEPETQEHLGGKLAIYNWLKDKYPNAYIALEERIAKTNQIADVYVDFGNGNKFAFEIQCAEQTADKWLERRKLYAIAGIKDIWLFGENYYKEINAEDIEDDEVVLRLKYQQQLVNQKERSVYFFDVKDNIVKHMGQFFGISNRTETRAVVKLQENALRLQRIQQRQEQQKKFKLYKKYLSNFSIEKVLHRMSHREQVLFKRLIKEYGFTDINFPGVFNIQMENYKSIHTPYPLWQLFVFHKAIKHNYSRNQLIFSKYLFQNIKDQIRYDSRDSKEVATIIHSYLVLLEKCGFLDKKTLYRKYTHPFTIENNVLPIVDDKILNSCVALYFSEFNLREIGWNEHCTPPVFIDTEEQQKIKKAMKRYHNLVINKMESPLYIEEGLIDWFQESVSNQSIQLEIHEEEFLANLRHLVQEDEFISQVIYDTFIALVEGKFN